MLADYFDEPEDAAMSKVEQFEKEVKEQFIKNPGQMRLLIVVDKLLTGFDAPSATYLYIDKKMRDHGLFQAICRVNRLDGDDKDYGYIVDYQDLFNSLEGAITDYTRGALDGYEKEDIEGLLTRPHREGARGPRRGAGAGPRARASRSRRRRTRCSTSSTSAPWSRATPSSSRPTSRSASSSTRPSPPWLAPSRNLANEMAAAGYTDAEAEAIKAGDRPLRRRPRRGEARRRRGRRLQAVRGRHALPARHLHPGRAPPRSSPTSRTPASSSSSSSWAPARSTSCPTGIKKDPEAVAETITNNMRKVIIDERAMNPKYYDKMSELLDALIEERRQEALDYQEYLAKLLDAAKQLGTKESDTKYPDWADNGAKRALVDFFFPDERPRHRDRHDRPAHQARRLGRQPDEGDARSSNAIKQVAARRLRPTRRTLRTREGAR